MVEPQPVATLMPRSKLSVYATTFVALLGGAQICLAGAAGVQDDAGFFSETAKADASFNIRALQESLKKDVLVETFQEIPADVKQGVNLRDKTALNRMFEQWSVNRARLQSVNGVYMLLVKEPAHLQVVVGNETQKKAFTLADRDTLVRTMLAKLRAKDYDAALREGTSFVASTMKSRATSRAQPASTPAPVTAHRNDPQPESSGGWILPLILMGGAVWVALAIVRALFRSGSAAGGGPVPGAAGGGGFFRNMLGGIFGAAAGMWMYDHFFGSHGSSSYGATPGDGFDNRAGDSEFTGQDTDYTSSGGGFGDDSGGGFGGGGDFGGGDSGGGGGDF